ncbi:hypothetical protein [Protofrankia coriariae]|uniref:Uncharacterized protein n=1 Tax=Protofrankia coriariae TaxID=1562887 RepID=A0ABR5F4A5_9ACTN|nr:hypothetical protein [Protofrankia coriariae]KLL11561.1 hypothetical protein FrCorBMG51_11010 [Protofrankia coriariae]
MNNLPRLALELPAPTFTGPPCPSCKGKGVTDLRYEWTTERAVLMVDVLCDDCTGCGSADHQGCDTARHAEQDQDDYPDDDTNEEPGCPSCDGRGWHPLQGFTEDTMLTLRMPCGCTEEQLVPAREARTSR